MQAIVTDHSAHSAEDIVTSFLVNTQQHLVCCIVFFTQAHHVQDHMGVLYFECDVHSVNKFHLAVLVSGMKGGPARWKWRRVLSTPVA